MNLGSSFVANFSSPLPVRHSYILLRNIRSAPSSPSTFKLRISCNNHIKTEMLIKPIIYISQASFLQTANDPKKQNRELILRT